MNLEHVAINVPNVREQVQWWKEHLGIRIVSAGDVAPYMNFIADDKGSMLELYSNEEFEHLDFANINAFNLHFAFSVDDMEGERDRLIRAGATSGWPGVSYGRAYSGDLTRPHSRSRSRPAGNRPLAQPHFLLSGTLAPLARY